MYNELVNAYGDRVRTHAIEVMITDLSGKYLLPDDSILRNRPILGVFTRRNPDDDAYAPVSNRPIISDAGLRSAYVTLQHNAEEILIDHPLEDLAISKEDRSHRKLVIPELTPSKSYILVANPTTPANKITVGESILLHFIYLDEN